MINQTLTRKCTCDITFRLTISWALTNTDIDTDTNAKTRSSTKMNAHCVMTFWHMAKGTINRNSRPFFYIPFLFSNLTERFVQLLFMNWSATRENRNMWRVASHEQCYNVHIFWWRHTRRPISTGTCSCFMCSGTSLLIKVTKLYYTLYG